MASKERTREILKGLYDAVVADDEKASAELSQTALEEGIEAYDAVMSGLSAGMEKVGQLYASKEYFVPVVINIIRSVTVFVKSRRKWSLLKQNSLILSGTKIEDT
ncbi:hypothetical protein ES703_79284 [subsurface metagenome]